MRPSFLLALASAAPIALAAQAPVAPRALPVSGAVRATSPIRLDGKLDEAAWTVAPVTDAFTQIDPNEGQPASQKTEVRVVYDDDALYVGVRLHDNGPITARLGRRDMSLGDSDWFGLMIDSYHDHRTAFGFDVNPAGVQRDEAKTINSDDNSWDAVWRVATSIDSAGWTIEYRVPFSQLRFRQDSALTWGVQFERVIGRNHEYSVSTYIPKKDLGGVPAYGHLEGLNRLAPASRLEVLPYTVARSEYVDRGANPFKDKSEYISTAGVDLRYRVASNLTLTASVNPDFGQVEVDPAVVNLGVYETFFAEKRPLFLEGGEIFDFGSGNTSGGLLFYSRRIGRTPTLGAPTSRADLPPVTTILGAGKLTGKLGGWSIGSIAALTGKEEARYLDASNVELRSVTEPRSGYFVGRGRREFRAGRSMLGGVVTGVARTLDSDVLRNSFRSNATAGGIDFRHESMDRQWAFRGDIEGSLIHGTPTSLIAVQRASNHYFQRPDALHLDVDSSASSLAGYGLSLAATKQGGVHWRGELAGAMTSPGYEVNDIGFAQRTDRRDLQTTITYLENQPSDLLRRWSSSWIVRSERNYANEPVQTATTLTYSLTTLGYWSSSGSARRLFGSFDDRLTRGGPIARRPSSWAANTSLSSDGRRPVTGTARFNFVNDEAGGWSWGTGLTLGLKTSTRWNLTMGPSLARASVIAQYVTSVSDAAYSPTYGRRYVFAPLSQTELGIETRFNYAFTPLLTLETYVQPLISTGDYGATKQLVAARTFDFTPYSGSIPNLDFNLRSLRGNSVLRWEWREGSTLYVAWQQSRRDTDILGTFDLDRDGRALIGSRPDNIFLVKINYWLAP